MVAYDPVHTALADKKKQCGGRASALFESHQPLQFPLRLCCCFASISQTRQSCRLGEERAYLNLRYDVSFLQMRFEEDALISGIFFQLRNYELAIDHNASV